MKKVLAVCGLGQGTSLILKMNIEQILGEWGVQADVEHIDVSAASSMQADAIVTNTELAKSLQEHEATLIIVDNYFDMDELRKELKEHFTT